MISAAHDTGGGASFHRGNSKQNYQTPMDFMAAVHERFGPIAVDLAADGYNHQAARYFDETSDSLAQPWHTFPGFLWLNPPFANIAPWAKKCSDEAAQGAKILFLVPASVGACWFRDYVHGKALVLALTPRLSFDGQNAYPKDCILACYSWPQLFDVWKWK